MATIEELQAKRANLIEEIKRRGGKDRASNYTQRLQEVDSQLRTMRKDGGTNAPAPPAVSPPLIGPDVQLNDPVDVINTQGDINRKTANENINLSNPNFTTPTGSSTTTVNPDGTVNVDQKLSDPQTKILGGIEGFSQDSLAKAFNLLQGAGLSDTFNPNLSGQTISGNAEDRKRIEDEVFRRLTGDMEVSKTKEQEQLAQTLYNRGIPVGSKLYNDQMAELNKRYDNLSQTARRDAVMAGGDEMTRQFGMEQQRRANEFDIQRGALDVNRTNLGTLQGWGASGFMPPNLPGYTPTQMQAPDVGGTALNYAQLEQQKRQLAFEREQARKAFARMGGGGGGGGGQPQLPPSPFNNTPPPGIQY